MNINLIKGDITEIEVDAVVNAANSSLMGGGGVDGAIHHKGGPEILDDCRKVVARQGGCPTGEAVITRAGNLPAKYVIHTVGPVWNGGHKNEETLLRNAYKNSLLLAVENQVKSIAFPNISTGIYGFPKDKASMIALHTIEEFAETSDVEMEITFVCFDDENYQLYKELLR